MAIAAAEYDVLETNKLISEYTQKKTIVEQMIHISLNAIKSDRANAIFKTFPIKWMALGITNVDEMRTILGSQLILDYDKIMLVIETSRTDEEIIRKLNVETYDLVMHIISSIRNLNISKCNLISDVSDDAKIGHISFATKLRQFKTDYSDDVEKAFADKLQQIGAAETMYLYHGTPYENGYSIFTQKIKNASKIKELFLHGSSYGEGIYLSNDISFSLGYSRGNWRIILVYEVANIPAWKKTDQIYVIPDEDALLLRYIIVFDESIVHHITGQIAARLNFKLTSGKQKQMELARESAAKTTTTKKFNRRLLMEYQSITKTDRIPSLGFSVILPEPDNMRLWKIHIHQLDNPSLTAQMSQFGIPYIEMEITFPESYPLEPPFPRIIKPRFQPLTGHITSGGSICMEAISKAKWCPATRVEALILQIKMVLADGGAKIDEIIHNLAYNEDEARAAFDRVMKSHGWTL